MLNATTRVHSQASSAVASSSRRVFTSFHPKRSLASSSSTPDGSKEEESSSTPSSSSSSSPSSSSSSASTSASPSSASSSSTSASTAPSALFSLDLASSSSAPPPPSKQVKATRQVKPLPHRPAPRRPSVLAAKEVELAFPPDEPAQLQLSIGTLGKRSLDAPDKISPRSRPPPLSSLSTSSSAKGKERERRRIDPLDRVRSKVSPPRPWGEILAMERDDKVDERWKKVVVVEVEAGSKTDQGSVRKGATERQRVVPKEGEGAMWSRVIAGIPSVREESSAEMRRRTLRPVPAPLPRPRAIPAAPPSFLFDRRTPPPPPSPRAKPTGPVFLHGGRSSPPPPPPRFSDRPEHRTILVLVEPPVKGKDALSATPPAPQAREFQTLPAPPTPRSFSSRFSPPPLPSFLLAPPKPQTSPPKLRTSPSKSPKPRTPPPPPLSTTPFEEPSSTTSQNVNVPEPALKGLAGLLGSKKKAHAISSPASLELLSGLSRSKKETKETKTESKRLPSPPPPSRQLSPRSPLSPAPPVLSSPPSPPPPAPSSRRSTLSFARPARQRPPPSFLTSPSPPPSSPPALLPPPKQETKTAERIQPFQAIPTRIDDFLADWAAPPPTPSAPTTVVDASSSPSPSPLRPPPSSRSRSPPPPSSPPAVLPPPKQETKTAERKRIQPFQPIPTRIDDFFADWAAPPPTPSTPITVVDASSSPPPSPSAPLRPSRSRSSPPPPPSRIRPPSPLPLSASPLSPFAPAPAPASAAPPPPSDRAPREATSTTSSVLPETKQPPLKGLAFLLGSKPSSSSKPKAKKPSPPPVVVGGGPSSAIPSQKEKTKPPLKGLALLLGKKPSLAPSEPKEPSPVLPIRVATPSSTTSPDAKPLVEKESALAGLALLLGKKPSAPEPKQPSPLRQSTVPLDFASEWAVAGPPVVAKGKRGKKVASVPSPPPSPPTLSPFLPSHLAALPSPPPKPTPPQLKLKRPTPQSSSSSKPPPSPKPTWKPPPSPKPARRPPPPAAPAFLTQRPTPSLPTPASIALSASPPKPRLRQSRPSSPPPSLRTLPTVPRPPARRVPSPPSLALTIPPPTSLLTNDVQSHELVDFLIPIPSFDFSQPSYKPTLNLSFDKFKIRRPTVFGNLEDKEWSPGMRGLMHFRWFENKTPKFFDVGSDERYPLTAERRLAGGNGQEVVEEEVVVEEGPSWFDLVGVPNALEGEPGGKEVAEKDASEDSVSTQLVAPSPPSRSIPLSGPQPVLLPSSEAIRLFTTLPTDTTSLSPTQKYFLSALPPSRRERGSNEAFEKKLEQVLTADASMEEQTKRLEELVGLAKDGWDLRMVMGVMALGESRGRKSHRELGGAFLEKSLELGSELFAVVLASSPAIYGITPSSLFAQSPSSRYELLAGIIKAAQQPPSSDLEDPLFSSPLPPSSTFPQPPLLTQLEWSLPVLQRALPPHPVVAALAIQAYSSLGGQAASLATEAEQEARAVWRKGWSFRSSEDVESRQREWSLVVGAILERGNRELLPYWRTWLPKTEHSTIQRETIRLEIERLSSPSSSSSNPPTIAFLDRIMDLTLNEFPTDPLLTLYHLHLLALSPPSDQRSASIETVLGKADSLADEWEREDAKLDLSSSKARAARSLLSERVKESVDAMEKVFGVRLDLWTALEVDTTLGLEVWIGGGGSGSAKRGVVGSWDWGGVGKSVGSAGGKGPLMKFGRLGGGKQGGVVGGVGGAVGRRAIHGTTRGVASVGIFG